MIVSPLSKNFLRSNLVSRRFFVCIPVSTNSNFGFSRNPLNLKNTYGLASLRLDKRFAGHGHDHGHHHYEEPPHFAYRGDGLPPVKCEEVQQMLHINQKLRTRLEKTKGDVEKDPGVAVEYDEKVDTETKDVYKELTQLYNKVLTSNWHDTVQLTMNMDIWGGVLARLHKRARDLPHVKVQELLAETLKIFDVLYQVEDLQDHLYELMEELSLNAGEGGSAEDNNEVTSNFNHHVQEVMKRYHALKQEYPEFTQKFKESLGYTLAVLRQRYTFDWPEEHSYFY